MRLAVELTVDWNSPSAAEPRQCVPPGSAAPLFLVLAFLLSVGCAPPIRSTVDHPLTAAEMAPFWENVDPTSRDLLYGVGGPRLTPDPDADYEITERDLRGFSTTFDVKDPAGRRWSVKIGPEAQSEVTASRIVWAMGYPQLPSYYLPRWRWHWPERKQQGSEGPARFRPKVDAFHQDGIWSWHQNPFVGTRPYRGLLVLMMILNSTDLKDENNALVREKRTGHEGTTYVVKDLGATFGDTGSHNPVRNDAAAFEAHPFLHGVSDDGRVRFVFRGRHRELLQDIRPADVGWTCERLARLTDAQWQAAFRAAGQPPEVAARFIARVHQKIDEGLALARGAGGARR